MPERRNESRLEYKAIPIHMRHVSVSVNNGYESRATVMNISSSGMKLAIDRNCTELMEVIKNGVMVNISFKDIPLRVSGQCVSGLNDELTLCISIYISNPYYAEKYMELLTNQSDSHGKTDE